MLCIKNDGVHIGYFNSFGQQFFNPGIIIGDALFYFIQQRYRFSCPNCPVAEESAHKPFFHQVSVYPEPVAAFNSLPEVTTDTNFW